MYILDLLKKKGILSEQAATEILTESEGGGVSIEAGLLARGVDPDVLLQNMGEYYRLPTRRIAPQEKITSEALRYIPEESARHYRFVPLEEKDGVLEVGITDPDNLQATDALNFISSKNNIPYKLVIILQEDFEKVLAGYENLTGEVDEALTDLESELTSDIEDRKKEAAETEVEKETVIKEDAPVTRIVATILRYAVDGHASDIHIEPTEE
ncbi:hypothetical protein K2X96_03705, partial [Patescibacteria group bacterium]|nr:hypothetical protein [Patescibacteria group bacterium]